MPPKPHEEMKLGKARGKKPKSPAPLKKSRAKPSFTIERAVHTVYPASSPVFLFPPSNEFPRFQLERFAYESAGP
jgi:hypothetical protein